VEADLVLDLAQIKAMFLYLMQNAYVQGGVDKTTHRLTSGISTGTNAAPEATNLYLFAYELDFTRKHLPNWKALDRDLQLFLLSFRRYIDDCFILSCEKLAKYWFHTESDPSSGVYPRILREQDGTVIDDPLKLIGELDQSVPFLDLTISVQEGKVDYKLYDKREHLVVNGTRLSDLRNFPHIVTALSVSSKYSVFTSQMNRFARRFTSALKFIDRVVEMATKMINSGYEKVRIINRIIRFNGWRPTLGKWKLVMAKILRGVKLCR
jgi:hypothetical protein